MPPTKKITASKPQSTRPVHRDEVVEASVEKPNVCTCEGNLLIVGGHCSTCGLVVRQ